MYSLTADGYVLDILQRKDYNSRYGFAKTVFYGAAERTKLCLKKQTVLQGIFFYISSAGPMSPSRGRGSPDANMRRLPEKRALVESVRKGDHNMLRFGFLRKKVQDETESVQSAALTEKMDAPRENVGTDKRHAFSGAVVSDTGCVRANNEDNFLFENNINNESADYCELSVAFSELSGEWHLSGVFDGMGGGELGEIASCNTAKVFVRALDSLSETCSRAEVDLVLRKAFLEANNQIVEFQQKHNMYGSTGTVLCTNGAEFKIYHLGDSRAYLLREDQLTQLTKDQTLAQMKLEVGMYRESDPAAEADRHKLTEYIGRDKTKEHLKPVESRWMTLRPDDGLLLCSDGLYDMCSADEIAQTMRQKTSPAAIAGQLVHMAKDHGGEDNITCVVFLFS